MIEVVPMVLAWAFCIFSFAILSVVTVGLFSHIGRLAYKIDTLNARIDALYLAAEKAGRIEQLAKKEERP